jgi:hypothetical protein
VINIGISRDKPYGRSVVKPFYLKNNASLSMVTLSRFLQGILIDFFRGVIFILFNEVFM